MALIFLKIALSSAVFIGIYYAFLQKEKMFQFNRWYLLITLMMSYTMPWITISVPTRSVNESKLTVGEFTQEVLVPISKVPEKVDIQISDFIWYALLFVSLIMLLKFGYALFKILRIRGDKNEVRGITIMTSAEVSVPFSFLNKVYLPASIKETDERILQHEICHVKEKHSLDILFVEILKIISWFNPALYAYKNAMKINHEFLADQAVLNKSKDVKSYQILVMDEIVKLQTSNLVHTFNFTNTKKRLIMMSKQKSKFSRLKKTGMVPLIAGVSLLVIQYVHAETPKLMEVTKTIENITPIDEASIPEIRTIVNKDVALVDEEMKVTDTVRKKIKEENKQQVAPSYEKSKDEVYNSVEENAKPLTALGFNDIRKKFQENFNNKEVNGVGTVRTEITFIVEKDGSISDIKATGDHPAFNVESVKALILANQGVKWQPGKVNGQDVRSKFRFPLTMHFESAPVQKN